MNKAKPVANGVSMSGANSRGLSNNGTGRSGYNNGVIKSSYDPGKMSSNIL